MEDLDSDRVKINEAISNVSDPVTRENTELHIRMANAAFMEYMRTVKGGNTMNTNNKGMENESLEQRVARLELQIVELSECCKSLAGYSALNVGSAGVRAMVERINKIFSNTGETNESNK